MNLKRSLPLALPSAIFAVAPVWLVADEPPRIPDIPDMQLHLDASAEDTLTLDEEGRVLEWRSTVNDITFLPADEFVDGEWAPTWVSGEDNVERPANNRAVVRFDGQSSLTSDSPDARAMTNEIGGATFFGVGWQVASGAQNFLRIRGGWGTVHSMFYRATNDHRFGGRRNSGDGFESVTTDENVDQAWSIDTTIVDYLNDNVFLLSNGEELISVDSWQSPGEPTQAIDSLEMSVGSDNRSPRSQLWDGDIAEIIYFNRILSPQERFQVGNYLAEKYDLEWPAFEEEVIDIAIDGPVRDVSFESEAEREYLFYHTQDGGDTWERVTEDPIRGTGETMITRFPFAGDEENFRLVEWGFEDEQGSGDTELPVTDGLVLRLDPSDEDSVVRDGLSVEEWHSIAGEEMIFTQDDPDEQPLFFEDFLNGEPVLIFDGDSFLSTESPAALAMARDIGALTFFGVGWNTSGGAQNFMRLSPGDSDTAARVMVYRATNDHRMIGRRDDDGGTQTITGTPRLSEEWGIDSRVFDFENARGFLYIEGREQGRSLQFLDPGRTSDTDSRRFAIGSNTAFPDPGQRWDGDLAEILVYDRALTLEERNQVGRYLSDKYGVPYYATIEADIDFEVTEGMDIEFTTELGNLYQVEESDDVMNWTPIGDPIEGAGVEETVFVPFNGKERSFLRVIRLDD